MKQARRTRTPRRQQTRRQETAIATVGNGPTSIDDFMRDQRSRLVVKREEIVEEQQSLTEQLTTIDHEHAAINAYEQVRGQQDQPVARARRPSAGKHPRPAHRPRGGARQKAAAPGPRKGSSREEVLNI